MIQHHVGLGALAVQLDVGNFCLSLHASTVRHLLLAGDKLIEIVIPLVVTVEHDKSRAQLKQLALGRRVLFHRLVIIQVILC